MTKASKENDDLKQELTRADGISKENDDLKQELTKADGISKENIQQSSNQVDEAQADDGNDCCYLSLSALTFAVHG